MLLSKKLLLEKCMVVELKNFVFCRKLLFLDFSKVVKHATDRLLVHRDALFKNMQGP